MEELLTDSNQCQTCIHYFHDRDGSFCAAFPREIPIDILNGKISHDSPVEGDNGIQRKYAGADIMAMGLASIG